MQRMEPDSRAAAWILSGAFDEETANQRRMRGHGEEFRIFTPTKRMNENRRVYSLNARFLEEFQVYPFGTTFLDVLARIYDMEPQQPIVIDERLLAQQVFFACVVYLLASLRCDFRITPSRHRSMDQAIWI